MKKYLSYILLGVMMSFAVFFIVLFLGNMYMSRSTIKFQKNEEYESKLTYIEQKLNNVEDSKCVDSLKLFSNYSKDTYYSIEMNPSEWINKIVYRNSNISDYTLNIINNCELNEKDKKELTNSYLLVAYTLDRITNDVVNNYKLSFGDVFSSYVVDNNISIYNYKVAKIEELHMIERIIKSIEGDK